jgi:YfiH family protein
VNDLQRNPQPDWLTPDWPAPTAVRALSTLRTGGASVPPFASLNLGGHVGDDATAVEGNRRALLAAAGLPAEPAWLEQVHGICVTDLDSPGPTGPSDAAVTRQPGRVCAILTADCLPVLLTGAAGDRVGASHAGWRGLAGGVIEATVSALGGPPEELLAWLGPAIGPRHFEVGAEVREEFLRRVGAGDTPAADAAADEAAFLPNARGRYMADLYALARGRLLRLGVERIYGGGECTYTDDARYFSHRREGRTGRQATLIWLEGPPHR